MFRTLMYPTSGACDYSVALPHWSYCSWFNVCWRFGVVGLEWYPCCRLKLATPIPLQPKLLMMDILMSEICWAHKKWNKIASDIKLVFYSSIMGMSRFWLKPDNNNTRFMIIYVQLEYLAMVGLWDGRHSLWGTTYGWRIDRWSWLNVTVQCRCLRRIDFKSFFLEYFEDDGLWICCEHTEKPDRYCVLKHSVCNVWKVFTETTFRQK